MTTLEKGLIIGLITSSVLFMLMNDGMITFLFYFFALATPFTMFVKWLKTKQKHYLVKTGATLMPITLFAIWFTRLVILLGESLSHF